MSDNPVIKAYTRLLPVFDGWEKATIWLDTDLYVRLFPISARAMQIVTKGEIEGTESTVSGIPTHIALSKHDGYLAVFPLADADYEITVAA